MTSSSYSSHFLKAMAAATVFQPTQPVRIASETDPRNAAPPKLQHALIGEK